MPLQHLNVEMRISKSSIKYYAISSVLLLLGCISFFVDKNAEIIPQLCFTLNLVFIVRFRKALPIFLLFIFFSLYSYVAIKANMAGLRVSAWTSFNKPEYINKVLLLNALFIYSFGNLLNPKKVCSKMNLDLYSFKSHYIFWPLLCIGLLMIQFGIKGDTILESGGYGSGTVERSTMHEYFILVYFVLLLVAPKTKFTNVLLFILLVLFVVKTILYGGRIEAVQICILYIYYRWILEQKENKFIIYSLSLLGYYVSSVFGKIRENSLPLLQGDYLYYLNPVKEEALIKRDYIMNNQGDVLQSSARLLGLIQEGILDVFTRIMSFIYMLLSVFMPSSLMPAYSNLSAYRQDFAGSGGGGLVSIYFYAWMGYAGPVFIGAFLAYFINKAYTSHKLAYKVYAAILLVMFPRWYAYNPLLIFKFCFLTVVVYVVFNITYNTFFSRRNALT